MSLVTICSTLYQQGGVCLLVARVVLVCVCEYVCVCACVRACVSVYFTEIAFAIPKQVNMVLNINRNCTAY